MVIGRNYLSYALMNKQGTELLSLQHEYKEGTVLGKNDFSHHFSNLQGLSIDRFHLAIDSAKSTLVPAAFYLEAENQIYLEMMHEIGLEETVLTQTISNQHKSLYAVKKATLNFLSAAFPYALFYDAATCLLNTYSKQLDEHQECTLFLNIKDESATLTAYQNKQLRLHQVYAECSTTDILYYVAKYVSVNSLEAEKIKLVLHGESRRMDEVMEQLSNYFVDAQWGKRSGRFSVPRDMDQQPDHYFINLFSLIQCA